MFEKLTNREIEVLLHKQIIGRLGCHADGITYIVPISYAYDGQYIYCRTYKGKKLDMLRTNPKVCFQVDDTKDMENWKSVIAWGDFEELTDDKQRSNALQILLKRPLPVISSATTHLGSLWPFSSDDVNNIKGVVFRICVREKTGRCEKSEVSCSLCG